MLSLFVVAASRRTSGASRCCSRASACSALGALICGLAIWAGSYALFVVGTAIFGTGQGPSTLGRAAAADLYPPMLRGRGVGTVATAGAIGAVDRARLLAIAAGGGAVELGIVRSAGPFLAVPLLGIVAVWLIATHASRSARGRVGPRPAGTASCRRSPSRRRRGRAAS